MFIYRLIPMGIERMDGWMDRWMDIKVSRIIDRLGYLDTRYLPRFRYNRNG